jgi:transitional endoplasmic reticulum ATPase
MPNFLELSGFDESKVVYATQTEADLHAHLWDPIRKAERCRKEGLPAKRAVLLHGPYGTGKSLAGLRTAVESVAVHRTFVMARPGQDDFKAVMQRALLLQPSIVFMEDVDGLVDPTANADQISSLLDTFDGIRTKNADLMIVLTTNHPDKLHKGMMRPGRLDALVEISNLDGPAIQKLFTSILGGRLDKKIEWEAVVKACQGYLPAFLKETADRTVRYAISRSEDETTPLKITTEDLVFSAQGLRPQFERMQDAKEFSNADTLAEAMRKISEEGTRRGVAELATKDEDYIFQAWDPDKLLAEAEANHRPGK